MPSRASAVNRAVSNSGGGKEVDQKAADRKKKLAKDAMMRRSESEKKKATSIFDDMGEEIVTEIQMPEWVELILAITRISELIEWVAQEREERAKDSYQNPYPELFSVVSSLRYEMLIAVLILLNCLMIGVEASWADDSADGIFNGLEQFFVFIFFAEWCMRVLAFGIVWVFDRSNAADTFLVFGTGVIPKWVLQPLGWEVGPLRILTVLRALRLARIVRTVRLMPQFKELWMLIQGLTQSSRPLLWTFVIGFVMLYVFGVAATELIGRRDVFVDDEVAQDLFGDPFKAMFTLFQLLTLDTWGYTIARPIMAKDWDLCLFFVFFIMVAVFVFWNLITAIIVENAMAIAKDDKQQQAKDVEAQKKKDLRVLADIFLEIDEDGSGELSADEFFGSLEKPNVVQLLAILELQVSDMKDVWDVLNDGSDVLTIKEFTDGLRRMKGPAKARDISDILKRLRQTSAHNADLKKQVEQFNYTLAALSQDVEQIQGDTGEVLGLFKEMFHRLQAHVELGKAEDRLNAAKQSKRREFQDDGPQEDGSDEEDSPVPGSPTSPK